MDLHTAHVHALFYWIEVALAPFVCYALYRLARFAWSMGWLDEGWPDPPARTLDYDDDEPTGAEEGEPAPWRR
jgi:hypothetical protein